MEKKKCSFLTLDSFFGMKDENRFENIIQFDSLDKQQQFQHFIRIYFIQNISNGVVILFLHMYVQANRMVMVFNVCFVYTYRFCSFFVYFGIFSLLVVCCLC